MAVKNKYINEYIRIMDCVDISDKEKEQLALNIAERQKLREKEQKKQLITAASVAAAAAACIFVPLLLRSGIKTK